MDAIWDILASAFTYGRWAVIALVVAILLWRARRSIHPFRFAREVAILVFAYFAYFLVRGFTEGSEAKALRNADLLIDIEESLGILWEPAWQNLIVDHEWAVTLANWAYIWGHWPVIACVAVWLYLYRERTYFLYRNAFIISGGIGLIIFMTFPVAPPRLTDMDVVDTVTTYSKAYRVLQPPALVNQYAAVPSLHFGWNLLIGIVLVREAPWLIIRALGVVTPVVMFLAIVVTANHFILDAVAGAAVALVGLFIAYSIRDRMNLPPMRFPRRFPARLPARYRGLGRAQRT